MEVKQYGFYHCNGIICYECFGGFHGWEIDRIVDSICDDIYIKITKETIEMLNYIVPSNFVDILKQSLKQDILKLREGETFRTEFGTEIKCMFYPE